VWRARSSAGSEISVGICAPLEAVLLHGDSNALPGTLPPSSAAAQSWGGSTRASTPSREEDETHIHEVLVCSSPGADSVDFSRYLLIYPHLRLAASLSAEVSVWFLPASATPSNMTTQVATWRATFLRGCFSILCVATRVDAQSSNNHPAPRDDRTRCLLGVLRFSGS